MKTLTSLTASLVTAGFVAAVPLGAQAIECSELTFTGEVGERFPNAGDYCLEVAERDGKPYAHFVGEVRRVQGGNVYLRFKKPDGDYGPAVSFRPPSDFRARIDGRSYSVRSLTSGQELDVWVPEDDWEIAQHDSAEELVEVVELTTYEIVEVDEEEYTAAATLPSTASPWPLIGLLGGVLLAVASLIGLWRRRSAR